MPFLFKKNCFSKNLAYKMIIFKNFQVENLNFLNKKVTRLSIFFLFDQ